MPARDLQVGESLDLRRGDVVVLISVEGPDDALTQCLASVLSHSDPSVTVLVCDDAAATPGTSEPMMTRTDDLGRDHDVRYLLRGAALDAGVTAAAPADVVILSSNCAVTEGWLAGLREALDEDSKIATATALSNADLIVSVPVRNHASPSLPEGMRADDAAAAIRRGRRPLRPDLPSCGAHCVYIRRSALELAGPLDPSLSPGLREADFSQRCVVRGLRHVLADDVFVLRHGAPPSSDPSLIAARYPWYDRWLHEVAGDDHVRLASALGGASRAIRPTSVTVDGRCLTTDTSGTAVATLELIAALDAHTDLRLRVVVPSDLGSRAREVLRARPAVEILEEEVLDGHIEPTDVAHRPYQVGAPHDLLLLSRLGRRVVITQLDTIAYRNPAYFEAYDRWLEYRRLVGAALSAADQVVFISRAAADDALALDLAIAERTTVIPLATRSGLSESPPEPVAPPGFDENGGPAFLLCLGADFQHKNRPFAIRLLERLVTNHGFDGVLVLAGPKVPYGSSAGEEADYLRGRPELAARVRDLPAVSEAGKLWLLAQAAAVIYPTTHEGFGLIPFEAARVGTPCLFARHSSLAEYLPETAASIVPWDVDATAARVVPILVSGAERDELVSSITAAAEGLTSERNAKSHLDVYARAISEPSSPGVLTARAFAVIDGERRSLRAELSAIYDDPLERGLAGRYAILPPELRRPVLAMATRPALRTTAMVLYRAATLLGRVRRRAR